MIMMMMVTSTDQASAGFWGDYNCDLPSRTFTAMVSSTLCSGRKNTSCHLLKEIYYPTRFSINVPSHLVQCTIPPGGANSKHSARKSGLHHLHRWCACTWCLAPGCLSSLSLFCRFFFNSKWCKKKVSTFRKIIKTAIISSIMICRLKRKTWSTSCLYWTPLLLYCPRSFDREHWHCDDGEDDKHDVWKII